MPFITFIYRIGNNKKKYYGKYVSEYISDDHEGLDSEIKPDVINGINAFRKQNGSGVLEEKEIKIVILSFTTNQYIPTYSTDNEIECFDFYYKYFDNISKTYINGKLIK